MVTDQLTLFQSQLQYEVKRAADARKAIAVTTWMRDVSDPGWRWFIKVLRGNDTKLSKAHQAGPYMGPREVTFSLFPSFAANADENCTATLPARIDSHALTHDLNVKWWGASKRETHLTGWGGMESPVLDPDATGSIVVLAFRQPPGADADAVRIWLCSSVDEEDAVQELVGPVEPGRPLLYEPDKGALWKPPTAAKDGPCALAEHQIPEEWKYEFPTGADIAAATVARLKSALSKNPDERLLARRNCEYELFRSLERTLVLPRIVEGFKTVDLFVQFANSVTNRRKSRAGTSLGLHASTIFIEEGLSHSYDKISEGKKRPDFLFPSADAYHAAGSSDKLLMLAAKTTCKDRWRQILNEADKIPVKHLLTLQEGISPNQFAEMEKAKVVLVVPDRIRRSYHESIQPKVLSLSQFIALAKAHCG